jgi:hypothetical protein
MEKIIRTDRVRNEEPLLRVKKERNILHKIKRGKDNFISHILCMNCLLNRVFEGKSQGRTEVMERPERVRKQLLYGLKDEAGYWN